MTGQELCSLLESSGLADEIASLLEVGLSQTQRLGSSSKVVLSIAIKQKKDSEDVVAVAKISSKYPKTDYTKEETKGDGFELACRSPEVPGQGRLSEVVGEQTDASGITTTMIRLP